MNRIIRLEYCASFGYYLAIHQKRWLTRVRQVTHGRRTVLYSSMLSLTTQ